ncbi:hypothetical protein BDF14DRAFT_1790075 [Spinellus fusiger]|nr:hypothetical protein BDF14DRAFT_1790075 [Spinellus fusiger]
MRLLTDSLDSDDLSKSCVSKHIMSHHRPNCRPVHSRYPHTTRNHRRNTIATKMNSTHSSESISSDESSTRSSPPADSVFDFIYNGSQHTSAFTMPDIKDSFCDPLQHSLLSMNDLLALPQQQEDQDQQHPTFMESMSSSDVSGSSVSLNDSSAHHGGSMAEIDSFSSFQRLSSVSPSTLTNQLFYSTALSEQDLYGIHTHGSDLLLSSDDLLPMSSSSLDTKWRRSESTLCLSQTPTLFNKVPLLHQEKLDGLNDCLFASMWPSYLCLYVEYSPSCNSSVTATHTLAQLSHCQLQYLPGVDSDSTARDKCPPISELTSTPADVILSAKLKMDINLNLSDFYFNNTSFFETSERRTIECTSTIYSFGTVVLESKEIQQALWLNEDKYMYSFVCVNQFFDAFMKGIRALPSWEEIDVAINNLCLVQVFEDVEVKYANQILPTSLPTPTVDPSLLSEPMLQQDMSSLLPPSPSQEDMESSTFIGHSLTYSSLNNLSKSLSSPLVSFAPLLTMVYEFERGQGTIDLAIIGDCLSKQNDEKAHEFLGDCLFT